MLDKSVSYTVIAEKFGIGKSTVSDLKKNKEKILCFQREMMEMEMKKEAKTMRLGDDKRLDQALYLWFKQKHMEGVPATGPLLYETINGETKFPASEGWKWRFCQRHGIRQLSVQGEKLSGDEEEADKFVSEFRSFVMERVCHGPGF